MIHSITIPLFKGKAPFSLEGEFEDVYHDRGDGIIRQTAVAEPTLEIFQPSPENNSGTAIIICPGGGFAMLAMNIEGTDIAKFFAKQGITGIVLRYRLPDSKRVNKPHLVPFIDGQQAVALVRSRAKEWNIDANKIGVMGFSAGAQITAFVTTHFDQPIMEDMKSEQCRPDFSAFIYPVTSFCPEFGHKGSARRVLRGVPEMVDFFSNEKFISRETPSAFLVHAMDDNLVNCMNSVIYWKNLKEHDISAELHIFPKGGHGFGLNNENSINKWPQLLLDWLLQERWFTPVSSLVERETV